MEHDSWEEVWYSYLLWTQYKPKEIDSIIFIGENLIYRIQQIGFAQGPYHLSCKDKLARSAFY